MSYNGTVYIAISGAEIEYPDARDSIQLIQRREGDSLLSFARATKGYESRQQHIENFLASEHDFILFLDGDQYFPRHTLERLRSHGLPFVSGFYPRRRYDFVAPVWYEPFKGKFPLRPWSAQLEADTLYEVGASGWGCVLVHRDVILGVRALLKGEWEVLEDDMDIFPYDLPRVVKALRELRAAVNSKGGVLRDAALEQHLTALEEEIVPFSGYKGEIVGSDIRFAVFAKVAGFQLYGDTGVDARHIVNYPVGLGDFQRHREAAGTRYTDMVEDAFQETARRYEEARQEVGNE